jgi:hypothetical protein
MVNHLLGIVIAVSVGALSFPVFVCFRRFHREVIPKASVAINNINSLVLRVQSLSERVDRLMDEVEATMIEARVTMKSAQKTMESTNKAAVDMSTLVDDVELKPIGRAVVKTEKAVGKFLSACLFCKREKPKS